MNAPGDPPPVLEEVRHRRVGKVVVAYLAIAFGVMQAAISYLPVFGAPEWSERAVLGAIVLGFPVTVVLAWIYDITPSGVVRTPDDLEGSDELPTSRVWLYVTAIGLTVGFVLRTLRG